MLFFVMFLSRAPAAAQQVLYVDADATGAQDGTSWADAFNDLQEALDLALPDDQIWVAVGTYTPSARTDPGDPRSATFHLMSGVGLYGGFAGYEGSLGERDIEANETTLSGDLNGDDTDFEWGSDCCTAHPAPGCDDFDCATMICGFFPSCCAEEWDAQCASWAASVCGVCEGNGNVSENSYHVVTGSGTDETAVVDGLTITAGNADGNPLDPEAWGGGMFNLAGSPTVANCRFVGNAMNDQGGGMYNGDNSSPQVLDCTFFANRGGELSWGVGMLNANGSSPMLVNCTFVGNSAAGIGGGGGLYNIFDSNPMLINCRFSGNVNLIGGAMVNDVRCHPVLVNCSFFGNQATGWSGGAIFNRNATTLVMVNCLFSGNSAGEGGAVKTLADSTATFVNCTLTGNIASTGGGIYAYRDGMVTLSNCVLWGNSDDSGSGESAQIAWEDAAPIVDYSCIEGLTGALGGVGNIGDDPLFVNAAGFDGVPGTTDDDLRLSPGSPCIDAADNAAVPSDVADLDGDGNTTEPTPLDLDGNPRFLDDEDTPDTGAGTPPIVDMGALEAFEPAVIPTLSEWGFVVLASSLLAAIALHFGRSRRDRA